MLVYVLQHEHELEEDTSDVKLIGIYGSKAAALEAQSRLSAVSGFREYRDGFSIDAYELDQDHWTEGFSTVRSGNGSARTGTEVV